MEITFGIITNGKDEYITKIIESILNQNIKYFEIIIIGHTNIKNENIKIIDFDENIKYSWITKKKNLITNNAKYDTIVYMHDYIIFDQNFYQELQSTENFDVLIPRILNLDGNRFRDWTLFPLFVNGNYGVKKINYDTNLGCYLPYNFETNDILNNYIYFSGSFFIAKKHIMQEFPLDESLTWGQGEDVIWSNKISKKYKFKCNPKLIVKLLKQKEYAIWEKLIPEEYLILFK